MKHFQFFLLALAFLVLAGCDDDNGKREDDSGEAYFPRQVGLYHLYDVTQITYVLGEPETLQYELKTLMVDSFPTTTPVTSATEYSYVIQRSKKTVGQSTWQPLDTWVAYIEDQNAIVQEQNIPYVVLTFPLRAGSTWDGNAYNTQINPSTNTPEDIYTLLTRDKPHKVGNVDYPECAVVDQEDNPDLIVYYDKRFEVYAREVGLIYKEKTQLQYCTDEDEGCIGQQIVESGTIYKQTLKTYGKE